MPFGNEVLVMVRVPPTTVIEKFMLAKVPTLSVTVSVNGNIPAVVGVPPSVTPETLRPGARPEEALQL